MRHLIDPVLALAAVALGACSRPGGASNGEVSAPHPEPVSELYVARPAPPVDASPGPQVATSPSAEPLVNFELPSGCSEIYETNDVCKTVQALVDARTRLNNRACAPTFRTLLPDYSIFCTWQRFVRKPVVGADSKDCYADRYDGEGIVCWFEDPRGRRVRGAEEEGLTRQKSSATDERVLQSRSFSPPRRGVRRPTRRAAHVSARVICGSEHATP